MTTVSTSSGQLQGKLTHAADGSRARAFLRVPYASAARYAMPSAPESWEGVRDATTNGLEPVQRDEQRLPFQVPRENGLDPQTGLPDYMGEADQHTLNIFTPTAGQPRNDAEVLGPLPVLFYIFGGGFNNGAASLPMYDGTRLCNRMGGAVVVVVNYRLGELQTTAFSRHVRVLRCVCALLSCEANRCRWAGVLVSPWWRYSCQFGFARHRRGSPLGAQRNCCFRRRRRQDHYLR